jgi:hypothetical protein
VQDFYQVIQNDYFIKGQRSQDLANRWKHLEPVFGSRKARVVDEQTIIHYSAERLRAGARPAIVQREVSRLRRILRLGLKHKLISTLPSFPQIEQDGLNAR